MEHYRPLTRSDLGVPDAAPILCTPDEVREIQSANFWKTTANIDEWSDFGI